MDPSEFSGDRPVIVLITGAPGSGKSTLGAKLARELRLPFIARDDIRGGLFLSAGAWSSRPRRVPSNDESVEVFLRAVESIVGLGVSCVVEYVVRKGSPHELERLISVAECRVLHTFCHDAPTRLARRNHTDRLLNRLPVLESLGYSSIEQHTQETLNRMRSVVADMRTDFELPMLEVDTSDGYEPELDVIIDFVTDCAGSPR